MWFRLRQIGNVAAAVAHKAFSVGATGTALFVAPGAHTVVVGVYFFVTSATYHCRSPLTGVPFFGAPVAFFWLAVFAKIGTCPSPKLSPFAPVIIPCLCFCALLQSKKSGSNHIACHKKAYTVDSVAFLLYNNSSNLSSGLTLGAFVNNCRCLRRRVVALSENCGIRHSAFGICLRTNAQKCLCR